MDISDLAWRKSSYSGNGGNGDCVEVAFVPETAWRKSTRSGNGGNGNCVEVAFGGPVVAVRDSKNPVAVIAVPRGAWVAFVAGRPQR